MDALAKLKAADAMCSLLERRKRAESLANRLRGLSEGLDSLERDALSAAHSLLSTGTNTDHDAVLKYRWIRDEMQKMTARVADATKEHQKAVRLVEAAEREYRKARCHA